MEIVPPVNSTWTRLREAGATGLDPGADRRCGPLEGALELVLLVASALDHVAAATALAAEQLARLLEQRRQVVRQAVGLREHALRLVGPAPEQRDAREEPRQLDRERAQVLRWPAVEGLHHQRGRVPALGEQPARVAVERALEQRAVLLVGRGHPLDELARGLRHVGD